ncbi:MAG TPA: hypothetical protein VKT75_10660, partial [Acidobacteriaceae bacterium]|nr:hypothetical protein [Acidobacteriaceae bacterium]
NPVQNLPLTSEQRKLVDEYVQVRTQYRAWKPDVNPHTARFIELQQVLAGLGEVLNPEDSGILTGNKFVVPVSARERRRTIVRIPQLFRKLGGKWVAENCKPPLAALEKSLSEKDLAKFVEESRTGPRNLGEPVAIAATKAA